jgi:hypothetical protein
MHNVILKLTRDAFDESAVYAVLHYPDCWKIQFRQFQLMYRMLWKESSYALKIVLYMKAFFFLKKNWVHFF